MRSKIVPVKNVARLSAASRALLQRAPGAPGIGLIEGKSGFGKTTAITWLSNQTPSIYVRAKALWTPSAMLGDMCRELRIPSGGSCASQVDRIVEALSKTSHSVFIDETDYIVKQTRLIETLRDIHDTATVPVICIGEEGIATKLQTLPRFTNRIAEHVIFEPLDEADAQLIARELSDVTIRPDLVAQIQRDTGGNCRLIVVSIARAEQLARSRGLSEIGVSDIGKKALFTGEPGAPVRLVGAA